MPINKVTIKSFLSGSHFKNWEIICINIWFSAQNNIEFSMPEAQIKHLKSKY